MTSFSLRIAPALRTARFLLAIGFVVQLPAEIDRPLLQTAGLTVTNLELTAYALVGIWATSLVAGSVRLPRIHGSVLVLGLICLAGGLVATAGAEYSVEASLKLLLRAGGALIVGLAMVDVLRSDKGATVVGFALAAAVASAIAGIFEILDGWRLGEEFFSVFREGPLLVAGRTVRASGTLLHANLAGWYWGTAAVIALVAASANSRWRLPLGFGAIALLIALILTLSRGAVLATAVAVAVASLLMLFRAHEIPLRHRLTRAGVVALPLPIVAVMTMATVPTVMARYTTPTDADFYAFAIEAPAEVAADSDRITVPIVVTNESPVSWPAEGPIRVLVSYRLYRTNGRLIESDGMRTPLPKELHGGQTTEVVVDVDLPRRGAALIEWDLLQEHHTWFSDRYPEADPATTLVHDQERRPVRDVAEPQRPVPSDEELSRQLDRRELWPISLAIIRHHPLTGIGLDNFRHGYGEWAGLREWDTLYTAHSLYLELLASVGIPTAIAFFALVGMALSGTARSPFRATRVETGALVVIVTLLVHGTFDTLFIDSSALYPFAIALAIGFSARSAAERHS